MDESLAAALPAHATSAPISAPPFPFHARSYDAQQQRSTMGDLIASMLVRSGHTLTCAIAQARGTPLCSCRDMPESYAPAG
ncbi:hypothetical protein GQ55_5G303000 [Panicum hallii var. hallii]|uniref:Uncharacterized protein n=1 Tax=Panicum hallii var. hallii TaxID=1504633 RepID=A0A2T7DLK1_9POAL|nr:hypothetical protein GQ55_5G303000 [Panicum hallii var. hallii]